jgi:hypothetical protein
VTTRCCGPTSTAMPATPGCSASSCTLLLPPARKRRPARRWPKRCGRWCSTASLSWLAPASARARVAIGATLRLPRRSLSRPTTRDTCTANTKANPSSGPTRSHSNRKLNAGCLWQAATASHSMRLCTCYVGYPQSSRRRSGFRGWSSLSWATRERLLTAVSYCRTGWSMSVARHAATAADCVASHRGRAHRRRRPPRRRPGGLNIGPPLLSLDGRLRPISRRWLALTDRV